MINQFTMTRLDEAFATQNVSLSDRDWVVTILNDLTSRIALADNTTKHTQTQIGVLIGAMNLDTREQRIWMLETIVGFPLYYAGEAFEGYKPLSELPEEKANLYPGPSFKDIRLSAGMVNTLVDFYTNYRDGDRLHGILGLISRSVAVEARKTARRAKRQAREQAKQAAQAARLAKRLAKSGQQPTFESA